MDTFNESGGASIPPLQSHYEPCMTGNVYKGRKNRQGYQTFYISYFFQGKRFTIWTDLEGNAYTNHEAAYERLRDIRHEIKEHRHDPEKYRPENKSKYSLVSVIALYYETRENDIKSGRIGKAQLVNIKRAIEANFLPYLSANRIKDIREIKSLHIQQHFNNLPNWSAKTVKNYHSLIGAFLGWCSRMDYIAKAPAMPVLPPLAYGKIRFLTIEEQDIVLAKIPAPHLPIFKFLAWCGCRPSEARALQIQDVDFKTGVILIQGAFNRSGELSTTKTKRVRPLPLDEEIAPFLAVKNRIAGFVFNNPLTGNYYTVEALRFQWAKAVKLAGMRYVSLTEGTRKVKSTDLINRGIDTKMISEVMGNSPNILKRHYAQIQASRFKGLLGTVKPLKKAPTDKTGNN